MLTVLNTLQYTEKQLKKLFLNCLSEFGWESFDRPEHLSIGFFKKSEAIYFSYAMINRLGLVEKWKEWKDNHPKYPLIRIIRK